jgi:hypothetical protein
MRKNLIFKLTFLAIFTLGTSHVLAQDKTFNARIDPLSWLVGRFNITGDYSITPRTSIGPSVGLYKVSSDALDVSLYTIGINSTHYLTANFLEDGWYARPFITYSTGTAKTASSSESSNSTAVGVIFGYAWCWSSGFNMNLGLGAQYIDSPDNITIGDTVYDNPGYTGTIPSAEWTMGIAF